MTHSGSNPPLGAKQPGSGLGLPWQNRARDWAPGSRAELSSPPPSSTSPPPRPHPQQESAAGGTSPSRRGPDREGPREVWAQGTHPRQPNKGGLCAAGRRQDGESPRPSRPRSPRRSPADSCGRGVLAAPQWRRRRRAGRRRLHLGPLALSSHSGRKAPEQRESSP